MNKRKYEIDMCSGPIMSKLITFFVPLMLSGVLQLLFNAVDLVVVGRFSGSDALAAVGATTSLINMMINLFIGLSTGANVVAACFYASGNRQETHKTVHTAISVALCVGAAMVFAGFFFSPVALRMMGTPDEIIGMSVLYMRIYFAGMPFFMMYNYGAAILRAVGDTRRPLIYLTIAGVINAVLNLFMVVVLHFGVAGVAIATVIAQMISCVMVTRCLLNTEESYKLSFKKLHIYKSNLLSILNIGVPAGIQSTVITFSNVLLQSSVNSFGAAAMAGYTAANNIISFIFQSINAISQANMSFTSQNRGAGKPDRMDRVFIDCLILDVIVAGLLGIMFYVFRTPLVSIYTSAEESIRYGAEVLSVITLPYFFCAFMDGIPGALRGMGHSFAPMVLSVTGTVGARIVWIFGFFPHHRTLSYLFITYPLSWIVTFLMQLVCYYIVRKKVYREIRQRANEG